MLLWTRSFTCLAKVGFICYIINTKLPVGLSVKKIKWSCPREDSGWQGPTVACTLSAANRLAGPLAESRLQFTRALLVEQAGNV